MFTFLHCLVTPHKFALDNTATTGYNVVNSDDANGKLVAKYTYDELNRAYLGKCGLITSLD